MKRKCLISLMLLAAVSMAACGKAEKETDTGAESSDGGVKEFTAFFAVPGSEINDDNEIQQKIAEITGAKCKETWLTGQTAEEAVGTLIAGGEYPDMIDGGDGMAQLYDAGALITISVLLADLTEAYLVTPVTVFFNSTFNKLILSVNPETLELLEEDEAAEAASPLLVVVGR